MNFQWLPSLVKYITVDVCLVMNYVDDEYKYLSVDKTKRGKKSIHDCETKIRNYQRNGKGFIRLT